MGTPLPLPIRGAEHPQIFGPCLLRPNGWMDEGCNWHGGRPQPRRLCVRWGPSPLPPKGGGAPLPNFRPFLLCPNGSMHQIPLGMDVGLRPGDFVLARDPVLPPQQRGQSPLPIFGPFLLCPDGWMHRDATRYGGRPQPRRVCVRWGPSSLPKRAAEPPPQF